MDNVALQKIVGNQIFNTSGNAFQAFCNRLCLKLYPNDYTPVRAGGPRGDMKNDGYCPKARLFFAAHATRGEHISKTKEKIKDDLEGCIKLHTEVKKWIYLTNETLPGEIETYVDDLRKEYPKVSIETWGHKKITGKILEFPDPEISQILGITLEASVNITSEIEHAASLLKDKKPKEALVLLERLWGAQNENMSNRDKYRTKANIGHAYLALENYKKSADFFLEAKQYEPDYEKAREREALAYLILGNNQKAHDISTKLLSEYPRLELGRAVWIRSAAKNLSFDDILEKVPDDQIDNAEVSLAIAEVAMSRGDYTTAEGYIKRVYPNEQSSVRVKELVADLIQKKVKLDEIVRYGRSATKEEIKRLEEACSLFTRVLEEYQKQNLKDGVSRVYLKRASIYTGMGKEEKAEQDIEFAHEINPNDKEVIFQYAGIKEKHNQYDEAIELLTSLIGKDLNPVVELGLSQVLQQRNSKGDKEKALKLLKNRLNDLEQEDPIFRTEYLASILATEREINGVENGLEVLDKLPEQLLTNEAQMVLRSELFRIDGQKEEAIKIAKNVLSDVKDSTRLDDRRRIATLLQALGLHKASLGLWKDIVEPEYIGRDTYRLLECAKRCEDAQFVIGFSQQLRSNGLWDMQIFELELYYRELFNDNEGTINILKEYLRNPKDESYVPYIRTRLSLIGIRSGDDKLIEKDPDKLPFLKDVEPKLGLAVVNVLRYGNAPLKAVEYAYELLRLNWGSPDAHLAMMRVLSPIGPEIKIQKPSVVTSGAAVHYENDDTHKQHWHIIEDSKITPPNSSRNEFPVDHPISKKMTGKKAEDSFYLVKDEFQERTATIKNVVSKYIYRYSDCFEQFESTFPNQDILRKFIVKKVTGEFDFSAMDRIAQKDAEFVKKNEEFYRKYPVPLFAFADAKGKSILEAMNYIISVPSLKLRCCIGTDEELDAAEQAIKKAKAIVLDTSALIMA